MSDTEEYDFEESEALAEALRKKAEQKALADGLSDKEACKKGKQKYNEVRRRHVKEFLQKIDMRLDGLSNQAIANLLRALIALGLEIEDEEELEYWINLLTREFLQRLSLYFEQRDVESLWKQITQTKARAKDIEQFSVADVVAFSEIIKLLKDINASISKNPAARKRINDFFEKIEKVLKRDLSLKKNLKGRKPLRRRAQEQQNPLAILQAKMSAEGVERGEMYWSNVMSDYDASLDKLSFAQNWTIDNALRKEVNIQKINELRGLEDRNPISHLNKNEREKEEYEAQKEQQERELLNEQTQKRKEAEKQKNSELVEKEFQNETNQEKAKDYAEKKQKKTGKSLSDKDIKMLKAQAMGSKGR